MAILVHDPPSYVAHMGPTLGQLHICVFYFLMVHIVYHVYCVPVKF